MTDVALHTLISLYKQALGDHKPVRHATVTAENRFEHLRWMVDRAFDQIASGDTIRAGMSLGWVQSELVRAGVFTVADIRQHVRGASPTRPSGAKTVKMRVLACCLCGHVCFEARLQHWLPAAYSPMPGDELQLVFDPSDRLRPMGIDVHFIVHGHGFDYGDGAEFVAFVPIVICPHVDVEAVGLLSGLLKEAGWRLTDSSAGWQSRLVEHRSGTRAKCAEAPESKQDDEEYEEAPEVNQDDEEYEEDEDTA